MIEESPSPALSPAKRQEICDAAAGIATAAKYNSAGTVEFLYTDDGDFFFLEMNTRIQVEHPVTEMTYGIDLVGWQIRIAAGETLSLQQQLLIPTGHAIECRICAEDAFNDFMPETGEVLFVKAPQTKNVRFDSGLYQNQQITTAFDPMLAKLVVYADTREQAIVAMIDALKELVILGVKTNIDYLLALLNHPKFSTGDFDTGFIKKNTIQKIQPTAIEKMAALALAMQSDPEIQSLSNATPETYKKIGSWSN